MKKIILLLVSLIVSLTLFAQEISHDVAVINIEVPVRVFRGSTFVDSLTIGDFEVYEDGKLQKIEAVYLVKKTSIERREEKKRFAPKTSRSFYLIFEISEYSPKIEDGINYFFQNVLIPGDSLMVVTPMKTYKMKSETFEVLPKEGVVSQLKGILRKDTLAGNSEYRSAVKDLTVLARAMSSTLGGGDETRTVDSTLRPEFQDMGLDELINVYTAILNNLENLRKVDEQILLDFSNVLRDMEGQKYVFLFYQREFIPQIEDRLLNQFIDMHQDRPDIIQNLYSLFEFFRRDISFDVNRVKQAYADSSISIHFLFFTKPARQIGGVRMVEHSEDIFSAFNEMAQATGGITDSSANPEFLFQRAADATENYYLVYYSPKNYKKDGKFKKIEVKVKNKNYRVTHRAGYFAN